MTNLIDINESTEGITILFNRCNLNCNNCNNINYQKHQNSNSFKTIHAVANQILEYSCNYGFHFDRSNSILLNIKGGEPLLFDTELFELFEYLSQSRFNYSVYLHTNCTIDVEPFIKKFNDSNFSKLGNSLEFIFHLKGPSDGMYEQEMCCEIDSCVPKFIDHTLINNCSIKFPKGTILYNVHSKEDLNYILQVQSDPKVKIHADEFDWIIIKPDNEIN